MLVEKSWRNTNIDDGFCALKWKKKKIIYKNYIPGAFGLNKEPDFVVSIEEENKSTLRVELKFISDTDVANMIYLWQVLDLWYVYAYMYIIYVMIYIYIIIYVIIFIYIIILLYLIMYIQKNKIWDQNTKIKANQKSLSSRNLKIFLQIKSKNSHLLFKFLGLAFIFYIQFLEFYLIEVGHNEHFRVTSSICG